MQLGIILDAMAQCCMKAMMLRQIVRPVTGGAGIDKIGDRTQPSGIQAQFGRGGNIVLAQLFEIQRACLGSKCRDLIAQQLGVQGSDRHALGEQRVQCVDDIA